MRQIEYNNAAFTMRLEFPPNWDRENISTVNISIDNLDGDALLAATGCTEYAETALESAASVGDSTITIGPEPETVVKGDRLLIKASAAGPPEEVEVLSFNSSTGVVTLRHELRYAHSNAAVIQGLWVTYDLDTSTVATWTAALQVVITWAPNGSDDVPIVERGEVSNFMYGFPDFARRFEIRFPREWRIAENRIEELLSEAIKEFEIDLSSRDFHIHRTVDQALVHSAILNKARYLVVVAMGDQWTTEREVALEEYNKQVEIITNQPIWQDENQDGVKDDVEVDDYSGFLGMERGF